MRMNNLEEAGHWYRESLKAKTDHIPAHLTYGKLLSIMVSQADKCIITPLCYELFVCQQSL